MTLDLETIIPLATTLVARIQTLPSNTDPGRKGGYLFLAIDDFSQQHFLHIGTSDPTKRDKYQRLSREKGHHLSLFC